MRGVHPIRPQAVLIAEDDLGSLMALAVCLEFERSETILATDGAAALTRYDERGGQIEFVITDFRLPDCNGMELIAELRWQGSTVRMLLVTAALVDEVVLLQQGASAVMTKPLEMGAVLAWLRREQRGESARS